MYGCPVPLILLHMLAAQERISTASGFWDRRTDLEIGMAIVITVLSGTCGTLWAWGNAIRSNNAIEFAKLAKERAGELVTSAANTEKQIAALAALGEVIKQLGPRPKR